ncbi:MAG: DUF533 domain-containing protein [Pseudomonadota bacterium]
MATDLKRMMEQLLGGGAGGLGGLLGGGSGGLGGLLGGSRGANPQAGGGAGMGGLGGLLGGSGLGGGLGDILGKLRGPMGPAGQAAAAGGLLGSVLGGRGGGGLFRVGGMALLGLLAHRAYNQWQTQQGGATPAPAADQFARPEAADGQGRPFGISVVRAMIAAARADGQLDAQERERIFAEAERLSLSEEERGEIFGVLDTEPDPAAIARLAATDAQKAELYLASAMATGGADTAAERAYLSALANALGLSPELRAQLDGQLREAAAVQKTMPGEA